MLLRKWAVRRGAVGEQPTPDTQVPATGRQGKLGESIVAQASGKYYENASRGRIYAACDQGVGVTVQVTITTTATLSLHNPAASQKRIELCKLSIAYFSGTLGAGAWYHGSNPVGTTLPSSGTLLTATCTDIGNASNAVAVGVCRTGSTVVAGTAMYPFASSLPILASTAVVPFVINEDVDGIIVLEPGGVYQLLGVFGGTGSSPKVAVGCVWREVPYVSTQG
jgi:hypothetical protein